MLRGVGGVSKSVEISTLLTLPLYYLYITNNIYLWIVCVAANHSWHSRLSFHVT